MVPSECALFFWTQPTHLVVQFVILCFQLCKFWFCFPRQWKIRHHLLWVTQPPDSSLNPLDALSIKYPVAAEPEVSDTLCPGPAKSDMPGGVTPPGYVAAGVSLFPVDTGLYWRQTHNQKIHKRNISLLSNHLKGKFQVLGINGTQSGFQFTKLFCPMKDNAIVNESAQGYVLVQPCTVFTHSQNEGGPCNICLKNACLLFLLQLRNLGPLIIFQFSCPPPCPDNAWPR